MANELNSYWETLRVKLFRIHRELEEEMSVPVTTSAILDRYYGNDVKMLMEVFHEHNDKMPCPYRKGKSGICEGI